MCTDHVAQNFAGRGAEHNFAHGISAVSHNFGAAQQGAANFNIGEALRFKVCNKRLDFRHLGDHIAFHRNGKLGRLCRGRLRI